ncbi:hypothetical protein SDC9_134581 [bioreactor metagenome]|uniref:Uncharacterized protein n=1 Tax=bioreactor metagenome TaxID=1076179 RepID=A0A645DE38_9ZZZZ
MSFSTTTGPPRTTSTVGETPRKPASTLRPGSTLLGTPVVTVGVVGRVTVRPARSTTSVAGADRLSRIIAESWSQSVGRRPLKLTMTSPACTPMVCAGVAGSPGSQVVFVRPAGMTHSDTDWTVRVGRATPAPAVTPRKSRKASRMFIAGPPNMMIRRCQTGFWYSRVPSSSGVISSHSYARASSAICWKKFDPLARTLVSPGAGGYIPTRRT